VTGVCCESSARDAMMRNFRVVMLSDGNAAKTDAEHEAALVAFYLNFGDVMETGEAIACLQAAEKRDAA
jgi:ureidoacrylate peracid hydrolase